MLAVSPSGWSEFDSLTAGDWALTVSLDRPSSRIYRSPLHALSQGDIDPSSAVCPFHFRCAQIHGHVYLSFSGASFGQCRRHGGRWAPMLVYWACGAFHIWRSSVRSRHFSPHGSAVCLHGRSFGRCSAVTACGRLQGAGGSVLCPFSGLAERTCSSFRVRGLALGAPCRPGHVTCLLMAGERRSTRAVAGDAAHVVHFLRLL